MEGLDDNYQPSEGRGSERDVGICKSPKRRKSRAAASESVTSRVGTVEAHREPSGIPSASAPEQPARRDASVTINPRHRSLPPSAVPTEEAANGEDQPVVKQPRRRVFWTKEDTEAVIDLVREHGSFWAFMEKQGRNLKLFSVPRTQQQIRDKARNVKVDMLRYVDITLRPRFHQLTWMSVTS